jgi:hypothetical protein
MTDLSAAYAEARDRLFALTDGMSHEAFNAKPSETSWSAGECVVHLNTIAKGYLPALEAAVADPAAPRGTGPFRYGWMGRKFVDMLRPGTRPMPTAGAMKPPATEGLLSEIDLDRSLERFRSDIDRYLAVVEAADGLDLAAIKVQSPFMKLMRFPLGVFLEAMGQHCLRHVGQAERAVAATQGAS